MAGRALVKVIVCTPPPAILKLMVCGTDILAFAWVIQYLNVPLVPEPVLASLVELTVYVVALAW